MRRTSELEVTNLLTLCDEVSHLNSGDAAGYFSHADVDDGDLSDVRVLGVDHHDLSGGDCAQEGLTVVGWPLVIGDELGLVQVIGAGDLIDILDDSVHGGVPTVVEEGAQEGLVDSSALKQVNVVLLLIFGGSEHVAEGVDVVLEPKVICFLNIFLRLEGEDERGWFTGIDYDVVRVGLVGRSFSNRSNARLEQPKEPTIPVLKSIVRLLGKTDVLMIFYLLSGFRAEPTIGLVLVHKF
jgi:hypothetical protein